MKRILIEHQQKGDKFDLTIDNQKWLGLEFDEVLYKLLFTRPE